MLCSVWGLCSVPEGCSSTGIQSLWASGIALQDNKQCTNEQHPLPHFKWATMGYDIDD